MRWMFRGKFSDRIGKDYIYECSNCGNRVNVNDIFFNKDMPKETHLPTIKKSKELWCNKCKEIEK